MDDILVFGECHKQHDIRLEAVLSRLEENGITLNPEKCEFSAEKVEFLGHMTSRDGIEVDFSKVEAVQQMKAPSDVPEFRRFLGMTNQMGKHLPNLSSDQ